MSMVFFILMRLRVKFLSILTIMAAICFKKFISHTNYLTICKIIDPEEVPINCFFCSHSILTLHSSLKRDKISYLCTLVLDERDTLFNYLKCFLKC